MDRIDTPGIVCIPITRSPAKSSDRRDHGNLQLLLMIFSSRTVCFMNALTGVALSLGAPSYINVSVERTSISRRDDTTLLRRNVKWRCAFIVAVSYPITRHCVSEKKGPILSEPVKPTHCHFWVIKWFLSVLAWIRYGPDATVIVNNIGINKKIILINRSSRFKRHVWDSFDFGERPPCKRFPLYGSWRNQWFHEVYCTPRMVLILSVWQLH